MFTDLIDSLQHWVDTLPHVLQFFVVFLIGFAPILEGDIAAGIGIIAGIPWPLTFLAAAAGTCLAVHLAVVIGERLRSGGRVPGAALWKKITRKRVQKEKSKDSSQLMERVQKWGLPPAVMISGFVSPIALNILVLATAGWSPSRLRLWGFVSAVVNVAVVIAVMKGLLHLIWG